MWLALCVGLWIYSYTFDIELSTYRWGPVGWPRGIILLVVIAALAAFVIDWRRATTPGLGPDVDDGAEKPMDVRARFTLAATMILPLVYLWLLPRAGYFATTPFFIAAYMWLLDVRSWRLILTVTVVAYIFLLLVFSKLLFIPLPTGNWPGFYDFSNWLLVKLGN